MFRTRLFQLGTATALATSLITVPHASAQRGAPSTAGTLNLKGKTPPTMARKDIEKFAPVEAILDKGKDLKIDDAQKKQIDAMYKPYKVRIDSLVKKFDADQWEAGSAKSNAKGAKEPTMAERAALAMADQEVQILLIQIRDTYGHSEEAMLALLNEDQKAKAKPILDKLHVDMRATALGRARVDKDKLVVDTTHSGG